MEEFPYKRYYIKEEGLEKLIQRGIKYKPIYITKDKLPKSFPKAKGIYKSPKDDIHYRFGILTKADEKLNDLTDYFSEKCRVRCLNEKTELTIYEYFHKHKFELVEKLDKQNKPLTFKNLNQLLYKQIPHCTNYKITYILGVLNHFKPNSWLDLSAGWGDRLISAILYSRSSKNEDFVYEAVDPNLCLSRKEGPYQEIIKTLVTKSKQCNFKVHPIGAEKYNSTGTKFDLVYTSPPFFTFERYSHESEEQSISRYKTLDSWLQNFLFITIDIGWNHLKIGGNYLLYIEDKPEYPFMDRVLEYLKSKTQSKFEGYIYQIYSDNKYPGKDTYRKILWFSKN